jgi:glycosyltransferase involved in cell wall biosynthesis
MFSLPIVTTNWRGIPDMVADGQDGFLVPIKNSEVLAEKLSVLLDDAVMASTMGNSSRRKYESCFKIKTHLFQMEQIFKDSLQPNDIIFQVDKKRLS